jgi:hypothetical protein
VIDTHEELLIAFAEAAELEHSLICQYLFAANSIKVDATRDGISAADATKFRLWREQILVVARQETGHLGTVWNLTALIGGERMLHAQIFRSLRADIIPQRSILR